MITAPTTVQTESVQVCVFTGEALGAYSFGEAHPFGPARQTAFLELFQENDLDKRTKICKPAQAPQETIELFHSHDYVEWVKKLSEQGTGLLDAGDTPAFPRMYEAAATVVGTTVSAVDKVMSSNCLRAFIPIAGLHHARRDRAAGFCIFNDCGVAIEYLRYRYGLRRILYVDIDAHHGDGVLYGFEQDPDVRIVDLHEDGRYLYPGTGSSSETGVGPAVGTKQNYPMTAGANDANFLQEWERALEFMEESEPEFILLQCGADSLDGDPLTHLRYTAETHYRAAFDLAKLADRLASGRVVAMGGGGYNLQNIAQGWCAVIRGLLDATSPAE
ncbi:MAG: acetoin utilization protein AcuC [Acidiferrobacterales bacterium]|nr:acetoin utilization protein AcuC [Acidiferrobacterales bacterium]